ncbi:hypothetical protein EBZ39_10050 [bacterium]|nr:hypothetical protein [bacterium]
MPQSRIFPFRRVSVDHMVRGTTRVWWQLERTFNDPGPYVFQLQLGKTGLRDAVDWVNIGPPVLNGYNAYDPEWRETGYDLLDHYRVVLTTPTSVYVSQAANCYGDLPEKDWVIAREIIRKEQLRFKYVAVPGYLVKPFRFGKPCTRCRDQLTQEVLDSDCPVCNGTGFEVGYHPPLSLQCWDLSTQTIQEGVDAQLKGITRENPYITARVIGFPAINKNDIWVNGSSDERWLVETIQIAAAIRNVPLVYQIKMGLLPFSNTAYAIEVGGEPAERVGPTLPIEGCGAVPVDQNYGGNDRFVYKTEDGCPIQGATIHIYAKDVFDVSGFDTPKNLALGVTSTTANGRWVQSIALDPGDYAIVYEKLGEYGPDVDFVNVVSVGEPQLCTWAPTLPIVAPEADGDGFQLATEDGKTLTTADEFKICDNNPPAAQQRAPDNFWDI